MRLNTKKQPFIQCRACGTIKFSKNVNNFLSTNPITLILSSLVYPWSSERKKTYFSPVKLFWCVLQNLLCKIKVH